MCRYDEKVEGIRFCAGGSGIARGEGVLRNAQSIGNGEWLKKARMGAGQNYSIFNKWMTVTSTKIVQEEF